MRPGKSPDGLQHSLLALALGAMILAPFGLVSAQAVEEEEAAQLSADEAPPPVSTEPAEPEARPREPDERLEARAARREPEPEAPTPPIMVAALATGRAPAEMAEAVRAALVAQITPMAGGRPVLPLAHEGITAALIACAEDAPCLGGQIAQAGAIGAIVATLSRARPRDPVELRISMLDPISGASRVPALLATLEEGADVAATLTPLVEQLRPMMFSPPPPPPTLLITVNVDGASVRVDGEEVGVSPLAQLTLRRGRHVIMVTAVGHSGTRREVELEDGESERVDITLSPSAAVEFDPNTGEVASSLEFYEDWPFWVGVGGGVVAIIVIIAVGVAVADSNQGPAPNPIGIRFPPLQ